jgi:hypothetical protein
MTSTSSSSTGEEDKEADEDDGDDSLITVRMDRNLLNCPVCHKPLQSSVYQVKIKKKIVEGYINYISCSSNFSFKLKYVSLILAYRIPFSFAYLL